MPYVEIAPSLPIYYRSSGTGTPIVFIHPPHMGHQVFKYQNPLSNLFQVITYDLRGHGNSGGHNERTTIQQFSEDLGIFLDELGISQAIIVGYSAGGTIAQEFALNYPERVKALILSGGYPEVRTLTLRLQYHFGFSLVQNGNSELLSKLLAKSHKVTQEDQSLLFKECLKADPKTAFDYYESSLEYKCTDRLKSLTCPLLTLYGQFSYIRPYMNDYNHLPQMKSVLIKRAFHQLPIKKHQAFNHALVTFLKEI